MKKPEAHIFCDYDGIYTKYCRDKATAIKTMQEEISEYQDKSFPRGIRPIINEETVKESRYRRHNRCEIDTINHPESRDDGTCYECGEPCGTVGRKTFVCFF